MTDISGEHAQHHHGAGLRTTGSGLSAHILPTSATMIGVCMTVLSIGHLGPGGELRMVVDKLLAVNALVFLVSALLSFCRCAHPCSARATRPAPNWCSSLGWGCSQ